MSNRFTSITIGLSVACATLAFDQLSKWAVLYVMELPVHGPIVVTSFFRFTMVWNRGISFGMFSDLGGDGPIILTAVAALIVLMLLRWMMQTDRRWLLIAQGLVVGGAVGNVIDRWLYGAVADFIDVHLGAYHWPAFNIADSAIFIGVMILLLDAFKHPEKSTKKSKDE